MMSGSVGDMTMGAITAALRRADVVPFLGAGVNLSSRPHDASWQQGIYLPSGAELAEHLARYAGAPNANYLQALTVASQYVEVMQGQPRLYEALDELFDADYPPTDVHDLLVELRSKHGELLILTTNYDDALERAFLKAGFGFDLVTYIANPRDPHRGRFRHKDPDGNSRTIDDPETYRNLDLDQRSIVLKIHGTAHRSSESDDTNAGEGYVITEDDYIEYMARQDGGVFLPAVIGAKLQESNILFLGYSLGDWNLRVLLRRIWGDGRPQYPSWAVQLDPDPVTTKFWQSRGVDIISMDVATFVTRVRQALPNQGDT